MGIYLITKEKEFLNRINEATPAGDLVNAIMYGLGGNYKKMKSELINKIDSAVGSIHLSRNLVISLLQELVIAAQAVTVNVHHPDYMKKEEIVALYEKITGDKISKTFVKSHKREVFIDLAADTVAEELADVLWLIIDLSNRLGVDLEQAFRDKELKNQSRKLV